MRDALAPLQRPAQMLHQFARQPEWKIETTHPFARLCQPVREPVSVLIFSSWASATRAADLPAPRQRSACGLTDCWKNRTQQQRRAFPSPGPQSTTTLPMARPDSTSSCASAMHARENWAATLWRSSLRRIHASRWADACARSALANSYTIEKPQAHVLHDQRKERQLEFTGATAVNHQVAALLEQLNVQRGVGRNVDFDDAVDALAACGRANRGGDVFAAIVERPVGTRLNRKFGFGGAADGGEHLTRAKQARALPTA